MITCRPSAKIGTWNVSGTRISLGRKWGFVSIVFGAFLGVQPVTLLYRIGISRKTDYYSVKMIIGHGTGNPVNNVVK